MTFSCLESLEENPVDIFLQVTEILLKLIDNVLLYPSDPKYRKLRLGNKLVSSVIMPSIGAMECLFEIGFQEGDDALLLPPEKTSVEKLSLFRSEISVRRNKHLESKASSVKTVNSNQIESSGKEQQISKQIDKPLQAQPSTSARPVGAQAQNTTKHDRSQTQQPTSTSNSSNPFLNQLDSSSALVMQFELKTTKDKVLSVVPLAEINERVQRQMRAHQQQALKAGSQLSEANLQETILLMELMNWFKNEFFEWVDRPECGKCKFDTKFLEMSSNPQEKVETDRVEVFKCGNCSARVLFPRINNPSTLMSTRRGRCGEWAIAFTAVCRALGWEARLVYDVSDHVWTEVYFKSEDRWVHCDPCECVLDKPLLYEKGWNKKLSYIIGFSCEDVQDVTWRYSANHKEVLARRNKCTEQQLVQKIHQLNQLRQANLTAKRRKVLAKRTLVELVQLMQPAVEQEGDDQGRKSGSLSWRLARSETSADQETKVSYVWTPTTDEVESKKMTIGYCTAADEYKLSDGNKVRGWKSRVFLAENVFRKEEKDWKATYLCRTENSTEGRIQWRVDLTDSGVCVDQVRVRCQSTTFENGKVVWLLCAGDKCVKVDNGELSSTELRGTSCLTLSVSMSGGKGNVAWQHAQIFRQQLNASEPIFQLDITFRKPS